MKYSTIIFLLIILFLIYCYQHRNQISEIIESFTTGVSACSSTNLLPPLLSVTGDTRNNNEKINVPYKDVVNGTMTYNNDLSCLVQNATSANCYTNHFMFTPLDKTKIGRAHV